MLSIASAAYAFQAPALHFSAPVVARSAAPVATVFDDGMKQLRLTTWRKHLAASKRMKAPACACVLSHASVVTDLMFPNLTFAIFSRQVWLRPDDQGRAVEQPPRHVRLVRDRHDGVRQGSRVVSERGCCAAVQGLGGLAQIGFGQYISNERAIIMMAHVHALGVSMAAAFGPRCSAIR